MRRYLEILRVPHLGAIVAASLLARLPMGINGLAIVLLLRDETGSFAAAGATAGALSIGTGIAAPFTARVIDRFGSAMLVGLAAVHAAGLGAIVALALNGAPVVPLLVAGLVAGVAFPPASSVVRVQYPILLADRPLLTAVLVAAFEPAAALAVSGCAVVAGSVTLVLALPPGSRAGSAEPRPSRLGALAAPGIRTLVAAMFPVGIAFGALEVALPAFADAHGRPELAGVLIAIWSLASVLGGLAYGARPRRMPLARQHLRVATLLPLSFAPLALAVSPLTMALLVIPAGVFIAPLIATRNELVGSVAPEGSRTEAYTWPLTALVGGIAVGAAVSGALADATSWQVAVLGAAAAAAAGAVVSTSRRATLAPAT